MTDRADEPVIDAGVARLLDAFSHCLGILGADGEVLFLNRSAAQELGGVPEDFVGLPLWETPWWRGDAQARGRLEDALEHALVGDTVHREEIVASNGGGSLTVRVDMARVDDGDGTPRVAWSAVDVTEMKDLEEVRSRMAAIVERSPDFVATVTPGGRLISLNRAGRAMVGIRADNDVVGRAVADFYPKWARTLVDEVAIPTAREKGSWTGRSALIGADGREIPTSQVIVMHSDTAGSVRFVSTVVRDATSERRAENRLETEVAIGQVLDDATSLVTAIPDILDPFVRFLDADLAEFWLSGKDGLVRAATAGAAALVEDEDVRQEPGGGSTLPAALWESGQPILVCPAGVLGAKEEEVRLPSFATSGLGFAIESGEGLVGAVVAYWKAAMSDLGLHTSAGRMAREMSAFVRREEAEASLRESRALAEEASRAKGEFVANMSHEIRSPMTAIMGYVEVLGRSLTDPDNLQVLEAIRRNGEHLLDVVSDILDLSRIEANKVDLSMEEISPAVLVRDVLGLMELRALEQGLEFSAGFEGEVPDRVVTDPVRVRQVLVNLLSNAIKFTPEGSVSLVVSARNRSLLFRVSDTGIGMPSEAIDELFEPFTQGDTSPLRPYEGTGLGLAISSRLASALGGDLEVESRSGKGSTFTLSVPLGTEEYRRVPAERMDEEVREVDRVSAVPSRRLRGRVLAVDDRPDMRILFRHLFEEAGAEVQVASDGEEAVRCIRESMREGREFGVVVMDVQMPGMDGLTATRQVRELGYEGAIIALTAGARPEDRDGALAAGCDEYAAKPIGGRDLVDLAWKYLERTGGLGQSGDVSGRRVLLIEDDPAVAEVMETLLVEWGCEAYVASNADEALAHARAASFDVVFCDLTLPGMSGVQLLPRLREERGCIDSTCVSLSGHSGPETEARSRAAGFEQHLVKPASFEALRAILSAAGHRNA